MPDLSQMSDADLMDAIRSAPDVRGMVADEANRQGVPPALALAAANTESHFDPNARSRKGAIGPMQLMPATAADLGVDPHDTEQNIRGGITYLKQQLDRFQNPQLALAAYNAGPGAVRKAGGVPNYPETRAYVAKAMGDRQVSDMSDAELMAAIKGTNSGSGADIFGLDTPAPAQRGGSGADIFADPAPPFQRPPTSATAAPPATIRPPGGSPSPKVDLAAEAAKGFMGPVHQLLADLQGSYAKTAARLHAPVPSFGQAASQALGDIGDTARTVGDFFGLAGAPIQAAVRPVAALAAQAPVPLYSGPRLAMQGGKLTPVAGQQLMGSARTDAIQSAINTAISAIKPAVPGQAPVKPMSLDELRAAKGAAYAKVDQSGFSFPQTDVQKLASDVAAEVARKGGPSGARLYPASTAMSDRLTALAEQPHGVPLSQLDELRSDIYGALVKPGDREAPIGVMMRNKIDALINASGAPDIATARDLNTRLMKAQAITDRLDSAGLRAGSTYSGGNYTNAVRQNLRPLVDPTSAAQIGNLTPEETAALRRVVNGTTGQNLTRYASKFLTNKFVQVPAALMTHGVASPVMEAAGAVLNRVGQSQTNNAVQDALNLIALGGRTPSPPIAPLVLAGRPAPPILSGSGLVGTGVLASHVPPKRHAR